MSYLKLLGYTKLLVISHMPYIYQFKLELVIYFYAFEELTAILIKSKDSFTYQLIISLLA